MPIRMLRPLLAFAALASAACAGPQGPVQLTRSQDIPWVELQTARGYNGSEAVQSLPDEVEWIDRGLRNRAVYREPGFAFGHLMLGAGALYPYHAHASPEATTHASL